MRIIPTFLIGLLCVLGKISGAEYGTWHPVSKHSINGVLLKFGREEVSWTQCCDQILGGSV